MSAENTNADQCFQSADTLLSIKRPEEALKTLLAGLSQHPDHARLHGLLGYAQHHLGLDDQAVQSIRKAISLDPNDDYLYRLGSVILLWSRRGRDYTNAATTMAMDALRLAPESHEGLLCLFNAQVAGGQRDAAKLTAEQLLKIAPDSADAHYCRGRLSMMEQEYLWAKKHFLEALKLSPEKAHAHYLLAVSLGELDHLDEAVESALAALQLIPANSLFKDLYAAMAKRLAGKKIGTQAQQRYGRPVQFRDLMYTRKGRHTARPRLRFQNFDLKYKKETPMEVPFAGSQVRLEFEIASEGRKSRLTCDVTTDDFARGFAFELDGRAYRLELSRSDMFDELGPNLLVLHQLPAPESVSGGWLLVTNFALTIQQLEAHYANSSTPHEAKTDGLHFQMEQFRLLIGLPKPVYDRTLSVEATALLKAAESLLQGKPAMAMVVRFSDVKIAEHMIGILAQKIPFVLLDAASYDPTQPPRLVLKGTPRQEQKASFVQTVEKRLPERSLGSGTWELVFPDVTPPEAWDQWLVSAGFTNATIATKDPELRVRGHSVRMEMTGERPARHLAAPFQQIVGQPMRSSVRWQFNSLPLACELAQELAGSRRFLVWSGGISGELRTPEQLRYSVDALAKKTALLDPGMRVTNAPASETVVSWNVLSGRTLEPADWTAFAREAGGVIVPQHKHGRGRVDVVIGERWFSALSEPTRAQGYRPNPRDLPVVRERNQKMETALGGPVQTVLSCSSNDRALLIEFARKLNERWPSVFWDQTSSGTPIHTVTDLEKM